MPVPLKASGSVTLVDDTGKTILKVSASGKASKGVFTLDNNSTVPMVGNATGACTDDADKIRKAVERLRARKENLLTTVCF